METEKNLKSFFLKIKKIKKIIVTKMKIIFLVSDHKIFLWSQKSFLRFFQESFDFFDFWTFFLSIFENPKHFSNKKKACLLAPIF
jgi:hypothetical protein